jgi:cell division protein FtsW (lipid II flippase)
LTEGNRVKFGWIELWLILFIIILCMFSLSSVRSQDNSQKGDGTQLPHYWFVSMLCCVVSFIWCSACVSFNLINTCFQVCYFLLFFLAVN